MFTGAFSHAIIDGMVDDGACGVAAGIGTGLWHACGLMACFHHGSRIDFDS